MVSPEYGMAAVSRLPMPKKTISAKVKKGVTGIMSKPPTPFSRRKESGGKN